MGGVNFPPVLTAVVSLDGTNDVDKLADLIKVPI
jgi:hypothetical protein